MPIYAYRCSACGHTKDVLQKLSDPILTECSACGAQALSKQITAAGFQLKGSGWYATDFKGNGAPPKVAPTNGDAPVKDSKPAPDTGAPASTGTDAAPPQAKPAAASPAPPAAGGSDGARGA
jgi:putative FmdB family regulatory protein